MQRSSYKKAEIVWIDDVFGLEEMTRRLDSGINFWEEMFGAPEKIYRLMNIKIKLITNYSDAISYINSLSQNRSTYYYFIVDLTLPKNLDDLRKKEAYPSYGKKIGKKLVDKGFAFSFLTSASELGSLRAEEKDLLLADFHIKEYHKSLSLPDSLKNKLLFHLQSHINWINIKENFFTKISESSNISNNQEEAFEYFPYLDAYKDFVNIAEFNELDLSHPIFIKSHLFNNKYYEQQCVLLLLSETFHVNRYRKLDVHYIDLSLSDPGESDIRMNEFYAQFKDKIDKDVIWIIKLALLDKKHFKQLQETLRNQKCIFIVNDEEYESYLEQVNSSYGLSELPYFKDDDYIQKKNLLDHILNLKIEEKLADREIEVASIYQEHPELLMDVQAYIALINPAFGIQELSDSYEMVEWVVKLFNRLEKEIVVNMVHNRPISYDKLIGKEILENLQKAHLQRIKEESAAYWLKTSWGFPHGVSIDKYGLSTEANDAWEMNSLRILSHLLTDLDGTRNETLRNLKEIFRHEYIRTIVDEKDRRKVSKEVDTMIKWPHREYPMPSILHKKFEEDNKHLWFNHTKLNYVSYSRKLSLYFRQLDLYLDYYDIVLEFIHNTYQMLPRISHRFIEMALGDITEKKFSAKDSEFKEEFKKYLYGMLSISLIFTEIIEKNEISDIEFFHSQDATDLASYGPKLQQLRNTHKKIKVFDLNAEAFVSNRLFRNADLSALRHEVFHLAETNVNQISTDFKRVIEGLDVSHNTLTDFLEAVEHDKMMEIDQKYVNRKDKYDETGPYNTNIYTTLLDTRLKQYSRWGEFVNHFDFPFDILKYMDTLLHFNLMVETRNKALEHNVENFDHDLLYESFIFTYESLWLQYQYIISCIDEKNDVQSFKTNFVKLENHIQTKRLNPDVTGMSKRSDFNTRIDSFYKVE
ncbi:MAG: hypothetical protein ACM3QZ_07075 [Solirubrobacterales bacterium]